MICQNLFNCYIFIYTFNLASKLILFSIIIPQIASKISNCSYFRYVLTYKPIENISNGHGGQTDHNEESFIGK